MFRALLLAACLSLSAGTANSQTIEQYDVDVIAQAQAEMRTILGFVENALSEPMSDLKARAEHGKLSDKLTYGLALKAGRMGAEGAKDAKKWIKRSRISNENTVPSGPAFVPPIETPRFVGGKNLNPSFSKVVSGENPRSSFSTQITMLDPVWINTASACVDALKSGTDASVEMSLCGGEENYRHLRSLMPTLEN